jgi:hypothetical protein
MEITMEALALTPRAIVSKTYKYVLNMAEGNRNENDMKALLQRCADTLLSAVFRMGRGSRTNTQTTNNNPNIIPYLTSSTHVGGRAASSSGTVSTLRPPLTSSTHVGGRAASSSGTE